MFFEVVVLHHVANDMAVMLYSGLVREQGPESARARSICIPQQPQ